MKNTILKKILPGERKYSCFVFKTTILNLSDLNAAAVILDTDPNIIKWSVDLDDRDHVLRVECKGKTADYIIHLLHVRGFYAEELPY